MFCSASMINMLSLHFYCTIMGCHSLWKCHVFHELANSKDPQHKMDNEALTEMQQKYPIDKLQKWGHS